MIILYFFAHKYLFRFTEHCFIVAITVSRPNQLTSNETSSNGIQRWNYKCVQFLKSWWIAYLRFLLYMQEFIKHLSIVDANTELWSIF